MGSCKQRAKYACDTRDLDEKSLCKMQVPSVCPCITIVLLYILTLIQYFTTLSALSMHKYIQNNKRERTIKRKTS